MLNGVWDDFGGDFRLPQELAIVGEVLARLSTLLELPILEQPLPRRIRLSRERRMGRHSGNELGSLNFNPRVVKFHFLSITRVVVEKQCVLRPQPAILDNPPCQRPFCLPADFGKDEFLPHTELFENPASVVVVVLGGDGVDDPSPGKLLDRFQVARDSLDGSLGKRSSPKGFVEVPDNDLDGIHLRQVGLEPGARH